MAAGIKAFAPGLLVGSSGLFAGYSLRETSGTGPAVVRLWDSKTAAAGVIVAVIQLPSSISGTASINDGGVWFSTGLFAEIVAGAVEGAVYLG